MVLSFRLTPVSSETVAVGLGQILQPPHSVVSLKTIRDVDYVDYSKHTPMESVVFGLLGFCIGRFNQPPELRSCVSLVGPAGRPGSSQMGLHSMRAVLAANWRKALRLKLRFTAPGHWSQNCMFRCCGRKGVSRYFKSSSEAWQSQ